MYIIKKKKLDINYLHAFLLLRNELFSFSGIKRPYHVSTGSMYGVLFEWTLQCLLETFVEKEGVKGKLNVHPNYPTSYVKKEQGHSVVNIDLAVTLHITEFLAKYLKISDYINRLKDVYKADGVDGFHNHHLIVTGDSEDDRRKTSKIVRSLLQEYLIRDLQGIY